MTIWDDRILELIRDNGPTPVGELSDHDSIRISHSSISRRCQKLAKNRLLNKIGNGVYAITEQGEAYLDEEYDAENDVFLTDSSVTEPTAEEGSIHE